MRLDNYLFEHSFAQSRNKAKELIEANLVLVDGLIMNKPSFEITNHEVKVLENRQYVGRAGKKLKYFLDES
ncbi:MAG: TlyA family RNA methyltransferase, partial [Campylobacterales bacterium]|nr:TlyA family RNA methyltransferase [Campylobacterales bacterium]